MFLVSKLNANDGRSQPRVSFPFILIDTSGRAFPSLWCSQMRLLG
jgi:hypothetical protein